MPRKNKNVAEQDIGPIKVSEKRGTPIAPWEQEEYKKCEKKEWFWDGGYCKGTIKSSSEPSYITHHDACSVIDDPAACKKSVKNVSPCTWEPGMCKPDFFS